MSFETWIDAYIDEGRLREPERQRWRRFWAALALSTCVDSCQALLRGDRVPAARIDARWRSRLGLTELDFVLTAEIADRVALVGPLEQEAQRRRRAA